MKRLIALQLLQMLTVFLGAPLLGGVINRLKANVQSRRGPSVVQPYCDLWKLLHKGRVDSEHATAPRLGGTMVAATIGKERRSV